MPPTTRDRLAALAVFASSVALLAVFLRQGLTFERLPGDGVDGILNLHTLEHWYRLLLQGKGSWLATGSFYPAPNTLGYSDALFLMALPYCIPRLLGADPFLAYSLTLILFCVVGYVSSYLLFRRYLQLHRLACVVGAGLATLNHGLFVSVHHTQLLAVWLVPILLVLVVVFLRHARGSTRKRVAAGVAIAIGGPSLLYTSYYVAWWLIFAGSVTWLVMIGCDLFLQRGAITRPMWAWLRTHKFELLGYAAIGALASVPFLLTYLPALSETGGRGFLAVSPTLLTWYDIFNLGDDNLLWRDTFSALFPNAEARPLAWELRKGFPPMTLLAFLVAWAFSLREALRSRYGGSTHRLVFPATVLGVAVFVVWLLVLRIGESSAWKLVHGVFPGTEGIRVASRVQHVLAFAVAAVVAVGCHRLMTAPSIHRRTRAAGRPLSISLFLVLIAVENVSSEPTYQVHTNVLRTTLARAARPPGSCRAFFLQTPAGSPQLKSPALQVLAMHVSQRIDRPTLNGYSGAWPPTWDALDVYAQHYVPNLVLWMEQHRMTERVCSLNLATGDWRPFYVGSVKQPLRLHADLSPTGYRASLTMIEPIRRLRRGERRRVNVRVANLGTDTLSGLGVPGGRFSVRMSYQWVNARGDELGFNNRLPLSEPIWPGQTRVEKLVLEAPRSPGTYELQIDLVQEHVAWFRNKGANAFKTKLTVH